MDTQQCQAFRADNTRCPHSARALIFLNQGHAICFVCLTHYNHKPKNGCAKEEPTFNAAVLDTDLLQEYQGALNVQYNQLRAQIEYLTGLRTACLLHWEYVTGLLKERRTTGKSK